MPLPGIRARKRGLPEQLHHVLGWAADEGAVSFDDDGALEEDGVRCDGGEDFVFGGVWREAEFFVFILFSAKDVVRA